MRYYSLTSLICLMLLLVAFLWGIATVSYFLGVATNELNKRDQRVEEVWKQ